MLNRERRSMAVLGTLSATLVGCTVMPPTNSELATKGPTHQNSSDACGRTWHNAKNCASFLIDQYTEVDANVGKVDSGFGLANLAGGTLGAIYLKSDTDRTQALEDLGVTLGALTGLRGFLRIEDKRKIVRTGVTAVQCMLDAAQATIDKADVGSAPFNASRFQPTPQFVLQNGVTAGRPADVVGFDLAPLNMPSEAEMALKVLFTDRVNSVRRTWVASGQTARAFAGDDCTAASTTCVAAKKLGAGLARIVSDVRLAWSKPVEGIDKLHETQRTLVNDQIGALVKAAQAQKEEQKKLEGSASMIPFGEESSRFVESLQNSAPDPAADEQLLSIYNKCVVPTPPAAT